MNTDFTEEEIQARLAGEHLKGPRSFKGQPLAELTKGLRDLVFKVVLPDDTGNFHDIALLKILAEAHAEKDSIRLEKRRALILATDDIAGFRAAVSLAYDELSDAEAAEAARVVNDILTPSRVAEVSVLAEKKSDELDPQTPPPTTTP